ncbi:MAG TPA: type VI secretion system lipoprotein TssJ [Rhizobiaceae bacterium]|nr:type VI secretion system lipoprotein TssJ [Rhizobiaceae bacterium]
MAMLSLELASCGIFGKKKPPAQEIAIQPAPAKAGLDLLVTASPLANPQPDGSPSPLVLRVYMLSGQTAFANASFRQLWENDAKTLGPTMLGKAEITIQPSGVKHVKAPLPQGTVVVAVVAGFRDFQDAKWRAMVPVQGEKQLDLGVQLNSLSVTLGPQQ